MMPLARAILNTPFGIPAALAEADIEDLYAFERALHGARNAVLDIALRDVACAEGHRIAAEYRRRTSPLSKRKAPTE